MNQRGGGEMIMLGGRSAPGCRVAELHVTFEQGCASARQGTWVHGTCMFRKLFSDDTAPVRDIVIADVSGHTLFIPT